jgi:hypothetical protein
MSEAVQELLKSFESLPESERHEVYVEILKRAQVHEYPDLDGEVLSQIADETFQMYDAEEAANGKG